MCCHIVQDSRPVVIDQGRNKRRNYSQEQGYDNRVSEIGHDDVLCGRILTQELLELILEVEVSNAPANKKRALKNPAF